MKAYEIINYLEDYFPIDLLNNHVIKCGLQIGSDVDQEINKAMVSLNARFTEHLGKQLIIIVKC